MVPTTAWWRAMRARHARPVDAALLPGALLERYEPEPGECSAQALVSLMVALGPLTTDIVAIAVSEGRAPPGEVTHKTPDDSNRRDLLPESRAPTKPT
jgi:hypothetical protein